MTCQIARDQILLVTRTWLNTPYRHQASLKGVGCDCLGLMRGVYRELYNKEEPEKVPPYTPTWYETNQKDPLLHAGKRHLIEIPIIAAKPGTVLVFRMKKGMSAKHCGIMTGPDTMIHAYSKRHVVEVNLGDSWKNKIVGAFDFPGVID